MLDQWRPSTATAESVLVIDRMILSVRMSQPTIACTSYQWDGQLTMHLQGSSKWHTKEASEYYGEAFENRVHHILGSGVAV